MSDFFIGELLVLVLLLPVVLRPFIRRLQRIRGIVFLPPVALALCILVIAGSGFLISFIPLFILSVVFSFAGIPRMARAMRNMATDWYPLSSSIFYGLLVLVFMVVAFSAVSFAPETSYLGVLPVKKDVWYERLASSVSVRNFSWAPLSGVPHTGTVIFFADAAVGADSRNTAACILAEKGYTVYAKDYCSFYAWEYPLMAYSSFRQPILLIGKIFARKPFFTDANEIYFTQQGAVSRAVSDVRATMQSGPLFILAEGNACAPTAEYLRTERAGIQGFICLASHHDLEVLEQALDVSGFSENYTTVLSETIMVPKTASEKPALLLSGEKGSLIGSGELDSNDVLAAILLGGSRDTGRKRAERLARRITDWCDSRIRMEETQAQ